MKLTKLSAAVLFGLASSGSFAAALDRSGQSIASFLQPGNYFEAGISILDPDVSGTTRTGEKTGDMAGDYYFPSAALKIQATDNISVGLIYDQPFGADAEYTQSNMFTSALGNTEVEVDTQNLSLILGFQPDENFNIYGGAVYQGVKGSVNLNGFAYSGSPASNAVGFSGYKANISEDFDFGWLAGISYQIPEIALKASVTYRSKIKHKTTIDESSVGPSLGGLNPIPTIINGFNGAQETTIETPQSVNLDLQTGIMSNTVAFANLRWVNWKDFSIRPHSFGVAAGAATSSTPTTALQNPGKGFDLVAYKDDQISATVGVGRKFNDLWAGNVSVGWDSGAGDPVTTLGPTEGYWNLGLGLQYSPTPSTFIAGGVKYFWLGDAKAQSGAQFGTNDYVAEFKDNDALAYGLKIGYKF